MEGHGSVLDSSLLWLRWVSLLSCLSVTSDSRQIGGLWLLVEGYTITRILQRFERIDVRWRDGEDKIKCEVVISPAHGVKVGFWEGQRKSAKILGPYGEYKCVLTILI